MPRRIWKFKKNIRSSSYNLDLSILTTYNPLKNLLDSPVITILDRKAHNVVIDDTTKTGIDESCPMVWDKEVTQATRMSFHYTPLVDEDDF